MKLSEKMNGISTNVNVLRFVAAVFVMFSHSFYVAASQEDPLSIFCNKQTNFGGIAVAILFFLSGFYVTKSLYKKNDLKEYFMKRCVRIFPQLWIVVLLSAFTVGPIFTSHTMKDYFLNSDTYLYLMNGILVPVHNLPGVFEGNVYDTTVNGPLWTMPVEFAAYCGLAFVLIISKYIFKNEKLQKVFHVICIGVLFIAFVVLDVYVNNDFLITVVRPFVIFFVGVLYCDYAESIKLNIPIAVALLVILIASCKIGMLNYALIICLPYVAMTFALGTKQIKMNSKVLAISYEMYLFGWTIQQVVTQCFGGSMNPYINSLITLPIDIGLAFGLYVFIEKQSERIRKRGCYKQSY